MLSLPILLLFLLGAFVDGAPSDAACSALIKDESGAEVEDFVGLSRLKAAARLLGSQVVCTLIIAPFEPFLAFPSNQTIVVFPARCRVRGALRGALRLRPPPRLGGLPGRGGEPLPGREGVPRPVQGRRRGRGHRRTLNHPRRDDGLEPQFDAGTQRSRNGRRRFVRLKGTKR